MRSTLAWPTRRNTRRVASRSKQPVRGRRTISPEPRRRRRDGEHTVPPQSRSTALPRSTHERDFTLLELLDRLLEGGVAIHGEVTLAVADIDLVHVGLRLVVVSVECLEPGTDDYAIEVG